MPTRASSSIVTESMKTPCPTVTLSPMLVEPLCSPRKLLLHCMVLLSWMLLLSPILMLPSSPAASHIALLQLQHGL